MKNESIRRTGSYEKSSSKSLLLRAAVLYSWPSFASRSFLLLFAFSRTCALHIHPGQAISSKTFPTTLAPLLNCTTLIWTAFSTVPAPHNPAFGQQLHWLVGVWCRAAETCSSFLLVKLTQVGLTASRMVSGRSWWSKASSKACSKPAFTFCHQHNDSWSAPFGQYWWRGLRSVEFRIGEESQAESEGGSYHSKSSLATTTEVRLTSYFVFWYLQ